MLGLYVAARGNRSTNTPMYCNGYMVFASRLPTVFKPYELRAVPYLSHDPSLCRVRNDAKSKQVCVCACMCVCACELVEEKRTLANLLTALFGDSPVSLLAMRMNVCSAAECKGEFRNKYSQTP